MRTFSGWFEHIGWRPTLEDKAIAVDDLNARYGAQRPTMAEKCPRPHSIYGVFDGHGGSECSEFLEEHILEELLKHPKFIDHPQEAFRLAFHDLDRKFRNSLVGHTTAGSTAVVCLVRGTKVFTANVGDSRAVMCRSRTAVALSDDHKPTREDEARRIIQNGGYVAMGRVCGALAVSRAFGDFEYKEEGAMFVTPEPEIKETSLSPDVDFLVLACDGIWDVFTNQAVCDFLYEYRELRMKKGTWQMTCLTAKDMAEQLVKEALNQGSTDNCTAIVVLFDQHGAHHGIGHHAHGGPAVSHSSSAPSVATSNLAQRPGGHHNMASPTGRH